MAAPKFAPGSTRPGERIYESPDHVPDGWTADRPADIDGRQPTGDLLGYQGPDQGYALALARRLRPNLVLSDAERADDAITACTAIAMRRASIFGRAPVIHDLRIAVTIWGFVDPAPPAELVALRVELFEGAAEPHYYETVRTIVDMIPESTLRMSPAAVTAAYPERWQELIGA